MSVNTLLYGDQILAAFVVLNRPLSLTEVVNYVAGVTAQSSEEIRDQVAHTLIVACMHDFVRRIGGNYVLAAGVCER